MAELLLNSSRLKILECLQANGPLNLSAISNFLNIPPQEVKRNLNILIIAKMIQRSDSNKYYLTILGHFYLTFTRTFNKIRKTMEESGQSFTLPCMSFHDNGETCDNESFEKHVCAAHLFCPLLSAGINHGTARLLHAVERLIYSAKSKLLLVTLHDDWVEYIIERLLSADHYPNSVVIVTPWSEVYTWLQGWFDDKLIFYSASPTYIKSLGGEMMLNEKGGVFIPLNNYYQASTVFIQCFNESSYEHLRMLTEEWLTKLTRQQP